MPFEVAGERVARPFRDGWAWMSDLLDAKDENEELREENEELRRELIEAQTAAQECALQSQISEVHLRAEGFGGLRADRRNVIGRPPTPYQQEVIVSAGSGDGVERNAPVVSEEGTSSARSPT